MSEKVAGFMNVAGIQSPGLASAPAIAEMVEDIIKKKDHGHLQQDMATILSANRRLDFAI